MELLETLHSQQVVQIERCYKEHTALGLPSFCR